MICIVYEYQYDYFKVNDKFLT